MDFDCDALNLNQVKNMCDRLVQKRDEEREKLRKSESNLNELRRQTLLLQLESREKEKLLKEVGKSAGNYQKSSFDEINRTYRLMEDYNNKANNVPNEHSLLERTKLETEADNLERFQDLPKILGEVSIMNKTNEIDSQLHEISALVETETKKLTDSNRQYVQSKKEREMMMQNIASFSTQVKKLNFKRSIAKKLEATGRE